MKKVNIMFFLITFLVAFCSIVYELVYSQILTVIFGGTVLRYSMTIGLFLFSLGIGSFLFKYIGNVDKKLLFIIIEIVLSLVGFLGVVFIFWINTFNTLPHNLLVVLSNIPIVLVGILSGLELPLLSYFVDKHGDVSSVLGMDYLGSLAGTFLYALVFYPHHGLFFSAFIVALFNMIVALCFFLFLHKNKSMVFSIIFGMLIVIYGFIFMNVQPISDDLITMYLNDDLVDTYTEWGFNQVGAEVTDLFITPYQMVFTYDVIGDGGAAYNGLEDTCLNIDEHIQMCERWVSEYHMGLITVPMAFLGSDKFNPNSHVLVIGGGDGIPANYLRDYNVTIDLIDIDGEFVEYAKQSELLGKYHNDSWSYEHLNVIIEDGLTYVKNSNKKYDLIILDLPGLHTDKVLHLYSEEFFSYLYNDLTDDGLLVSWIYKFEDYPQYAEIFMSTLHEAQFSDYLTYKAWYIPYDGRLFVDSFILTAKNDDHVIDVSTSSYTTVMEEPFGALRWYSIPEPTVRANSLFMPNQDMVIDA